MPCRRKSCVHTSFDVNDPSKRNFLEESTCMYFFLFTYRNTLLLPKTLTPIRHTVVHHASCTFDFYAAGIVYSGTTGKPYITMTSHYYDSI